MIKKYYFIIIFILLISSSQCRSGYIVNNLIEQNGEFYRKITKQKITGNLFRKFSMPISNVVKVGLVTKDGKEGKWSRWWENGVKKSEGFYKRGKKVGYWMEWDARGLQHYEILYDNGEVINIKNHQKQIFY